MSEATSGVDEALIASLAALRMDPLNTGIYRSHEKQQGVFDRPRLLTATHTTHTGLAWLQYLPQLPTHAVEFVDSLHSAQSHSVTRTLVRRKGPFFFFFLKSTNTLALGDLKVNTNFDDAAGRFSVAQVPLPSNAIDDADAINLAAAYSVIAADAELRTRLLQREREEKKGKKLTSFFFFFFFF
jgi:hypothetical protein